MSPEQARGEAVLDGRSDIYSLACLTYEMLAGEAPLAGRSPQVTMARRQAESPTSLCLLRDTVPEPLDAAVRKALARLPADRFPSAGQYGDAVALAAGMSTGGYVSVNSSGRIPAGGTAAHTATVAASGPAPGRLSFWEELKRRKVLNVATVYLMTAWVVVEASRALLEDLGFPNLHGYVWAAAALGLPVAMGLAWLFEVSREGVRRTGTFDAASEAGSRRWPMISRRALLVIAGIAILYVVIVIARGVFSSSS
jgi:hypothetical protein